MNKLTHEEHEDLRRSIHYHLTWLMFWSWFSGAVMGALATTVAYVLTR